MNRQDKARQLELVNKVWALVATHLRFGFDSDSDKGRPDDPYLVSISEIEDHKGRQAKAIRLLEADGYITTFGKMDRNEHNKNEGAYRVLRFEESEAYDKKPDMMPAISEINNDVKFRDDETPEKIARLGYKYYDKLSNEEKVYVWWHKDEYLQDTSHPHYLFEISRLNTLYKRILFVLIERRMKQDFPGYIQMVAPEITAVSFQDTTLTVPNPITFQDFNPEGIKASLEEYQIELERMTRYKADLDAIHKHVGALGGFRATIKHIRQSILADFLNGYERFPTGFNKLGTDPLASGDKQEGEPNRSKATFQFFDRFRDLCSYESLYLDTNIGSEEVYDVSIQEHYWKSPEVGSLTYKTLVEEFGFEKRDTGSTEDSDAA